MPHCPFCNAPWTAKMLEAYDAASNGGCSCCEPAHEHEHHEVVMPTEDIVCAACERVLFHFPRPGDIATAEA